MTATMRHINMKLRRTMSHSSRSLSFCVPGSPDSWGIALGPGEATLEESRQEPPDSIHRWPHLPLLFLQFLVNDNNNLKAAETREKKRRNKIFLAVQRERGGKQEPRSMGTKSADHDTSPGQLWEFPLHYLAWILILGDELRYSFISP